MLIAVLTALVVVTAFSSPAMAVRDLYQYSYDRCLPLFKDFESKAEVFTDFSEQFCACSSSQTHKYLKAQQMTDSYMSAIKIDEFSKNEQLDKITPDLIKGASQAALIETYYHHRCFVYTIELSCKNPLSDEMKEHCGCYVPYLQTKMKENVQQFDLQETLRNKDLSVLLSRTKSFNDALTSYHPDYAESCKY